MSDPVNESLLNDCDCCEGVHVSTPAEVKNRPGLDSIAYRVGTFRQFKESMLARLSSEERPKLADLLTREDDDFSIALLDAWAIAADVLTFYQERIANESYLKSAKETLSIRELAKLIGYKLSPGVAASVDLNFILDAPVDGLEETLANLQPAAQTLKLEPGIQVKSVPGQDETAQTFETIEEAEAHPGWNAMRPRRREFQYQFRGTTAKAGSVDEFLNADPIGASQFYLKGAANNLQKGDALLFVGPGYNSSNDDWSLRVLSEVETVPDPDGNTELDYTLAHWESPLEKIWDSGDPKVFAMRQRASLFGHNAPDPNLLSHSNSATLPINNLLEDNQGSDPNKIKAWKKFIFTDYPLDLNAEYPKVVENSWMVLYGPSSDYKVSGTEVSEKSELYQITRVSTPSRDDFGLSGKITRLETEPNVVIEIPSKGDVLPKAVGAMVSNGDGRIREEDRKFDRRKTAVFAQSEQLEIADVPLSKTIQKNEQKIILDRVVPEMQAGRRLTLSGVPAVGDNFEADEKNGLASEFLTLDEKTRVEQDLLGRDFTILNFTPPLSRAYWRKSVEINGNLVQATHGETTFEILGSGDAAQSFQRFALLQTPLTYVSSDSPSGADSTLKIYVNDLLWEEVPWLYGRGPTEHVYSTYVNTEGNTVVQFGDGVQGARLPTGETNVQAEYRKGIGVAGHVRKAQLSQLATRPLGLKGVVNPAAAEGAADPETMDRARENAPFTALTLDRAVSLRDYEDFARAFAGIEKARADWVWDGRSRKIIVAVAGSGGAPLSDAEGKTLSKLKSALKKSGDPHIPFEVLNFNAASFRFGGSVKVNPNYQSEIVLADVEAMLRDRFSFEARSFAQPVYLSEIVRMIQSIPGVVAVDVDSLHRDDAVAGTKPEIRLIADSSLMNDSGTMVAAELLMLHADPLDKLEEIL